jgi:hypothetical protein
VKLLKKIGLALLAIQCSINVLTVSIFLFAGSILRNQNGRSSALNLFLIWSGAILSTAAVGIFSFATQREQTRQKATSTTPEGGKVAQRDLTLATVALVSEMVTLYWVL